MDRSALPHGAIGIEADGFAIEFRGDKVVFVGRSGHDGRHFTLHTGRNSRIIDLHETQPKVTHGIPHRTLFALRLDDLSPVLQDLTPALFQLFGSIRRLRVGWLKHRHIGIARGIDVVSDDDIAAVTHKRKRRLHLDADLYRRKIFVPQYLDEVYDFPDGNFALFHRGRQIGFGFKKTLSNGAVGLYWIKRRDLVRWVNQWRDRVMAALSAAAIPPERYVEYPFLSR